jgi:hypothetical protein
MKKMLPQKPYPLHATWDGEGVNLALFSRHAEAPGWLETVYDTSRPELKAGERISDNKQAVMAAKRAVVLLRWIP